MSLQEFTVIFKESFDSIPDDVNGDTPFKELETWSSMQALLVISHVDDTIDVVLTADDIKHSNKLEDLYNIVKSKLV